MENYDEFELNGQKFKVSYKKEKKLVWAITYVNGTQVKCFLQDLFAESCKMFL